MQIYNTVLSTVPQNICFLGMTDKSKVHVPRYLQAVSAMRERNISVLGHGKIFFYSGAYIVSRRFQTLLFGDGTSQN